ncbi:helix-turn-helix domain-containing protein [Lysobacter enzymogenes]|uniref:helix-turn-helix domain-containing protein n=1 Tax=Lysobacter enzymogenes TaxID=69 RepID=UPI00339620FF
MHDTRLPPADLVRRAREAEQLSQRDFGALFGKSQGVVSRYESGAVDPPAEILMHCMHILAPSNAPAASSLEPAITGVRLALENLGRALDALQRVVISAGDMPLDDAPHSPLTGEGSRS